MPYELHPNRERGHLDHGWLKTFHSFSFSRYYNPKRMNFGALLVLNEDVIAPGQGFGEHFHDNMEIITIPLSGALKHHDSMGNGTVIRAGEVQVMSAGTGIMHSEQNASLTEPVHLLQIWVTPRTRGLATRYEQIPLPPMQANVFTVVAGPEPVTGQLRIYQDVWFSLGTFDPGSMTHYEPHDKMHGTFLFVIDGKAEVDGTILESGDALAAWDEKAINVRAVTNVRLLAIEVPIEQVPLRT